MDTIRYFLALLVIATFPAAFTIWLLIHSFVRSWRVLGTRITYVILIAVALVIAAAIYAVRAPLLAVDFGFNPWLVPLAVFCYGIAALIEMKTWKHLSLRTLVGLPEVAPAVGEQSLMQHGIYGKMRHPRYLGFIFGVLAVTFFANYLALYVFCPIFMLQVFWITVLEERELLERFGDEYASYRTTVPRLIPDWRNRGHRRTDAE